MRGVPDKHARARGKCEPSTLRIAMLRRPTVPQFLRQGREQSIRRETQDRKPFRGPEQIRARTIAFGANAIL